MTALSLLADCFILQDEVKVCASVSAQYKIILWSIWYLDHIWTYIAGFLESIYYL